MQKSEINILKGLAIVAVIILHIIPSIYVSYSPYPPFNFASYFLLSSDQLLRFCVPLFIVISGYTLGLNYSSPLTFYKKRLLRLLPLYFIWLVIINLTDRSLGYHLYFVPLLFQLYLFFPILHLLVKKFPVVFTLLVLIFQLYFLQFLSTAGWPDQRQYVFCFSWIFYFVLGIFLSSHKPKYQFLAIIIAVTGFYLSTRETFLLLNRGGNVINTTFFTRIPIFLYATGFCTAVILWQEKFLLLPSKLKNFLDLLGRQSYLIYLSHTLVLSFIFKPSLEIGLMWLLGLFLSWILEKFEVFKLLGQRR